MSEHDDIKVGSVWRSRDPRDNGRLATVEVAPDGIFGNPFVTVRSVRRSRMRTSSLLSRYDLVQRPTPPASDTTS